MDDLAQQALARIKEKSEFEEAVLVGLFWDKPSQRYSETTTLVSQHDFINRQYKFFYEFGKRMIESGVKDFNEVSILKNAKDLNIEKLFDNYGGLDAIEELIEAVTETKEEMNFQFYLEGVKKNALLMKMRRVYGDIALIPTEEYPVFDMTSENIVRYWIDVANGFAMETGGAFEIADLGISKEEFYENLEREAGEVLDFYGVQQFNTILGGMYRGDMQLWGGFGGSGKSTLMSYLVIGALINAPNEKAIVLLNEEGVMSFRKKILTYLVYDVLRKENKDLSISRKRLQNTQLETSDMEALDLAIDKLNELLGEKGRIKIVFVEKYDMAEVEAIIRRYAMRGYHNLIVDTHKVSENSRHNARWETLVEDTKRLYQLTRAEAGGLNLRTMITFQLSDSAVNRRFLGYDAMAESKAMKNEADAVVMFRAMNQQEYPEGKQTLKVYRYEMSKISNKLQEMPVKIHKDKIYYIFFFPKNRRGNSSSTGQAQLVVQADFNTNRFFFIGYTRVPDDSFTR